MSIQILRNACAVTLLLGLGSQSWAADKVPASPATTAASDEENSADQTSMREQYVKKAFDRFDTNHDGKIDQDEFRVGISKYLDRQRAAFNRDFDAADTNHDGKLSKKEVQKSNPVLYQHFSEADENHDGFLSKHEIRQAIRDQQADVTIDGDHGQDAGAGKN